MWLAIFGYTAVAVLLFFGTLTYFLCIRFLHREFPEGGARASGAIRASDGTYASNGTHTSDGRGFSCDTPDGCRIRGEILVPERPAGVAVVLTDLQDEGLVGWLLAKGIAVIRYSGRGCAGSGRKSTWGVGEARDLRLIYTTAVNREPDACRTIGTVGRKTGAVAALLHACIDDRVRFVVAVSPYADLWELLKKHLRDRGFPPFPMLQLAGLFCRWTRGVSPAKAAPAAEIRARGGLMKVSVLLAAEKHSGIPVQESARIAEALKGPVRTEILSGPLDRPERDSTERDQFRQWILDTAAQSAGSE